MDVRKQLAEKVKTIDKSNELVINAFMKEFSRKLGDLLNLQTQQENSYSNLHKDNYQYIDVADPKHYVLDFA